MITTTSSLNITAGNYIAHVSLYKFEYLVGINKYFNIGIEPSSCASFDIFCLVKNLQLLVIESFSHCPVVSLQS